MSDAIHKLSLELKEQAKLQGFNPIGIARVPGSNRLHLRTAALQRWLESGHHADMKWMESTTRQKIDNLLEGVNSVLVVGLNYLTEAEIKNKGQVLIGRYGWGKDYHKIIEKRLKRIGEWLESRRASCKWKVCVDTNPLLEKAWAEEAGLGWIGKHSNLINSKNGSWMVLGHLLCTEKLTPDEPASPLCGKCQKCIDACPTKAISEPFVVNSRNCIAYHTIENRNSELPLHIKQSMGPWIAGCDICQEVCPWNNKHIEKNNDPDLKAKEWIINLTLEDALEWDDEKWKKNHPCAYFQICCTRDLELQHIQK